MTPEISDIMNRSSKIMQAVAGYSELLEMLATKITALDVVGGDKIRSYYGQAALLCTSVMGLIGAANNSLMSAEVRRPGQVLRGWVFDGSDLREMNSDELKRAQEEEDLEHEDEGVEASVGTV